jgi:hypothetical protein
LACADFSALAAWPRIESALAIFSPISTRRRSR